VQVKVSYHKVDGFLCEIPTRQLTVIGLENRMSHHFQHDRYGFADGRLVIHHHYPSARQDTCRKLTRRIRGVFWHWFGKWAGYVLTRAWPSIGLQRMMGSAIF
jgi:hypothetical protein